MNEYISYPISSLGAVINHIIISIDISCKKESRKPHINKTEVYNIPFSYKSYNGVYIICHS